MGIPQPPDTHPIAGAFGGRWRQPRGDRAWRVLKRDGRLHAHSAAGSTMVRNRRRRGRSGSCCSRGRVGVRQGSDRRCVELWASATSPTVWRAALVHKSIARPRAGRGAGRPSIAPAPTASRCRAATCRRKAPAPRSGDARPRLTQRTALRGRAGLRSRPGAPRPAVTCAHRRRRLAKILPMRRGYPQLPRSHRPRAGQGDRPRGSAGVRPRSCCARGGTEAGRSGRPQPRGRRRPSRAQSCVDQGAGLLLGHGAALLIGFEGGLDPGLILGGELLLITQLLDDVTAGRQSA